VLLGALSIFQLALSLGAPLGRFAWGGQHRVLPARLRRGSRISILVYAVIALVVLRRASVIGEGPGSFTRIAAWLIVAYFFVGIGLNLASRSRPERALMTPVVAALCALSAVVALG